MESVHVSINIQPAPKRLPYSSTPPPFFDFQSLIPLLPFFFFYFFPKLKLLILSSRISVTQQRLSDELAELPLAGEILGDDCAAILGEDTGLAAGLSTSTTRTTALPSSTFRTLSASHCFHAPPVDVDAEVEAALEEAEVEAEGRDCDPENASQNALPNFLSNVWLATAAAAAYISLSFSLQSFPADGGVEVVVVVVAGDEAEAAFPDNAESPWASLKN